MIRSKTIGFLAVAIALGVVLAGNPAFAHDGGDGDKGGLRNFFFPRAEVKSSTSVSDNSGKNKISNDNSFHFNLGAKSGDADKKADDNRGKNDKDRNEEENHRIKGEDRIDFKVGINADNMDQVKARADQAIDNRVDDLNNLKDKVNGMTRLSSSVKASLSASIDTEISRLGSLKTKIDADTDIEVLKTDVMSITSSYRIYLLVIPQVRMAAVSDRINTIADMMTTIGDKFETRIKDVASGHDVTALNNYLSDYRSQIADARVQAKAAVDLTASLTVDNGDQAKLDANKQALKDAQAKLKIARDDLKAAREDAKNIIKGLVAFGDVSASSDIDLKTSDSK